MLTELFVQDVNKSLKVGVMFLFFFLPQKIPSIQNTKKIIYTEHGLYILCKIFKVGHTMEH